MKRRLSAACAVSLFLSGVAHAQIPPDLRDLLGARAGQAENQLYARGYQPTRTDEGRDAKFTYWRRGGDCVQITTKNGRYLTMTKAAIGFCGGPDRSGSGSSAGAVVAGVAIVGLAAALAAHNKDKHDATRAHDEAFGQGYRAGNSGAAYEDPRASEGYHEGYMAGEDARDNARFANAPLVRDVPLAARQACARRADDYQNSDGSVAISARPAGRGDFELTMATGSYRSRCTVSASGVVRGVAPY